VGKARGEGTPQRRVYKHALERIGVRNMPSCRQTYGTCLRFCLVPQGIRPAWLKRHVGGCRLTGHAIRRKASWVVPPFSLEIPRANRLSPPGEDGGAILVRRVNPSSCSRDRARGGSCRSAWNRCDGARGRQGTSEDGTISVKAPPAVAHANRRGGSASRTPRGVAVLQARARFHWSPWGFPPAALGDRGCIDVGSTEASVSE